MNKLLLLICYILISSYAINAIHLSNDEKRIMARASRKEVNGWIYLTLSGSPHEIGFQHGQLAAKEFQENIEAIRALTWPTTGMTYDFFVKEALRQQKSNIPSFLMTEMQGFADGATKAGYNTTLEDVIGWNANTDIAEYWWPTVQSQYGNAPTNKGMYTKGKCSAFVATGGSTADGKIVIGHTTFTDFWAGQANNVILDITPQDGARMVFQAAAGYVSSMTDFWVTSYGLSVVETTIVNYFGYNETAIPEWVRARVATQYARSIDEWVATMSTQNNGGYANSWLLADSNNNEIALYELGLIYTNYVKKSDGFFYGFNSPWDPRIRHLECKDTGFNDIRQQTGARRLRWQQLFEQYNGSITPEIGQKMLGDTYDVYLEKENPCSRCICSHYDVDPQQYVSDPNGVDNIPYAPFGSVDAKVGRGRGVEMWGVFGRGDGTEFNATQFLKAHAQWNWQSPYLKSRPAQNWAQFNPQ